MNKFFVALAAFAFGLTGAATADEATLLTDTQMDQIVAGTHLGPDDLILPDQANGPDDLTVADHTDNNDGRTDTGSTSSDGNSAVIIDDDLNDL